MALDFPSSPIEGNTYTTNNVTYVYSETKGIWYALSGNVVQGGGGGGGGASVTIATAPPESPSEGDLYWDEELGKLFIYYSDGDTNQWVEVTSTGVYNSESAQVESVNGANGVVSLNTTDIPEGSNLYFTTARLESVENVIPSADNTYSLGSETNRWKDIYLSGNTIHIGNVRIKAEGNTVSFIKSDDSVATISETPSTDTAIALAIALGS